jgi:hypothetical protein
MDPAIFLTTVVSHVVAPYCIEIYRICCENAWEHFKVRHIVELCLGVWCFHGNSMCLFPLGE